MSERTPEEILAGGRHKRLPARKANGAHHAGDTAAQATAGADEERVTVAFVQHGDLDAIPTRQWVYGRKFLRRHLTVIAAPGGVGKTTLGLAISICVALKKELLGESVHSQCKVLYCCLEDDVDELRRRLRAALLHFGLPVDAVAGILAFHTNQHGGITIAKLQAHGSEGDVVAADGDKLIRTLKEQGIGLVFVDPMLRAHKVPENSNGAMNGVMREWSRVALEADCAIGLVTHVRKGAQSGKSAKADSDIGGVRGAGAIVDSSRVALRILTMEESEGEAFGLEPKEQRGIIQVVNGKLNVAPSPEDAEWYRLVNVDIGNAPEGDPLGASDQVQAIERWKPPTAFHGVSFETCIDLLEEIKLGLKEGARYSASPAAKARSVVKMIAERADVSDDQARRMVSGWKKSGILTEKSYHNGDRREGEKGLFVDAGKLAAMVRDGGAR